jgi:hypothetical protein
MGFFSFLRRTEKEHDTGNHRSNSGKKNNNDGRSNKNRKRNTDGNPRQRQPSQKRGALFLGICDMRYATISLNCLHIFAIFFILLLQLFGLVTQDKLVSTWIGIGLSGLSIMGAIKYSFCIMYTTTLCLALLTVYYLVDFHIFLFIMGCFLTYAQCFSVHEMRLGIMTQERYDTGTEEFITPEGRVVVDKTVSVATEMVESTKKYGDVAVESTKKASGLVAQQSTRVMEQYVAPTLFGPATKRNGNDSDSCGGSMVIVKDYEEV